MKLHGPPPSSPGFCQPSGLSARLIGSEAEPITGWLAEIVLSVPTSPTHQFREVDFGQGERLPPRTESLQRVEVGGLVVRSLDCDGEEENRPVLSAS